MGAAAESSGPGDVAEACAPVCQPAAAGATCNSLQRSRSIHREKIRPHPWCALRQSGLGCLSGVRSRRALGRNPTDTELLGASIGRSWHEPIPRRPTFCWGSAQTLGEDRPVNPRLPLIEPAAQERKEMGLTFTIAFIAGML